MVFCGECGSPVPSAGGSGDRSARNPGTVRRASTLVGSLPGVPVSPSSAPPVPSDRNDSRRTVVGMPGAFTTVPKPRAPGEPSQPTEGRMPAVTMVSPVSSADREPRSGKGGGKKRRASVTSEAVDDAVHAAAPPAAATPAIEGPPRAVSPPVAAPAPPNDGAASGPKPRAPAEPPPSRPWRPRPAGQEGDSARPPAAKKESTRPPPQPARSGAKARVPVDDAPQIEVHAEPAASEPTVSEPVVSEPAASVPAPSAPATVETGKAPEKHRTSNMPPLEADETQRLLDDLDAGFDSIVRPSAPVVWIGSPEGPGPRRDRRRRRCSLRRPQAARRRETAHPIGRRARARHEADMAEVRALFAGIAVAYARPLRDFMIEVAWGEPTKEWLDVALPAAQALRRAAAAVELPELDGALEGYSAALELAAGEASVDREVREMLAGAYAKLIDAMPAVFALDGELGRREPIIVRSLLMQVPGVRHVAIDKLYRAGINALDVFYAARARELAEATGLDEALAAAICERFQRYKREVAELSPGKDRARERAELATLTAELDGAHAAHEKAAASWGPGAASERARARQARTDTLLRIDLLLAHLGEIDLQRTIAKVPFQQKVKELRRYLEDAEQRASR